MAQCPQCQLEYSLEPGHNFCENCRFPLNDSQAAEGQTLQPTEDPSMGMAAPVQSSDVNTRSNIINEGGNSAGRDLTIHQTIREVFCVVGSERLKEGEREWFHCSKCQRQWVCDQHFDRGRNMCETCAAGPRVACGLCNDQLPVSETFTCPRCIRIAGKDHLDPEKQMWCVDCRREWAKVIDDTNKEEVGVSKTGKIVGRDDVVLKDKVLQTKEGDAVHLIKDNIWYARPGKQWYLVKPPLLAREEHAMRRFYPNLKLQTAPNGDKFWQGSVSTWTGNEYEIRMRYPDNFPYAPLRAYVVNPKIEQSRHIYPDGHLCLFHIDDKTWETNTTGATAMSWVSLWLHCYEVWLDTGEWPRKEHDNMVINTNY